MLDNDILTLPTDKIAIEQGCYYDPSAADRAVKFFPLFLRHTKGQFAKKPFVLLEWQSKLIKTLFGWKAKDGLRRFRRCYVEVPKKNGKSVLCAGIALLLLIADKEIGAQVYLAASDREQASIIFRECQAMVRGNGSLADNLITTESKKIIQYPKLNSFLKALSADAYRNEGLDASAIIFDELHSQPNRDLWDCLSYAGSARRQPLLMSITTAGFDRESICYEQRRYADNILNGTIPDITFLPLIYGATEEDDWTKETTWFKCNPSLGETITLESFKADFNEAVNSSQKENAFKRYRLNIWTQADVRWLKLIDWDKCLADMPELKGRVCYAALDLSATTDLTSFALLFPMDNGEYYLLVWHWIPELNARERERRDKVPYLTWHKQGHIETTPGNVIDYEYIRKKINELNLIYSIKEIALDRWNATGIATQLEQDGFIIVPFGQGFNSMSAPTKEYEVLVLQGKMKHNDNPVLRWEIGNCAVEQDATDNIKPSKKKSTERIGGVVASIMALGRAIVRPKEDEKIEYISYL
jgi:phage terminase large subunit-like protein